MSWAAGNRRTTRSSKSACRVAHCEALKSQGPSASVRPSPWPRSVTRSSHWRQTADVRDEPMRSSSWLPETSHRKRASEGNSERITRGRFWPGPAVRDVRLEADVRIDGAANQSQLAATPTWAWFRPTADVRPRRLSDRTGREAAGRLRARPERQSRKNRVPVSSRSCGPAVDPEASAAPTFRSPRTSHSTVQTTPLFPQGRDSFRASRAQREPLQGIG